MCHSIRSARRQSRTRRDHASVTGRRDTRLVPARVERALDALVPSSVVELPGLGRDALRAIVRIVRGVPTHVLEAGTDLAQIPVVIRQLLERG